MQSTETPPQTATLYLPDPLSYQEAPLRDTAENLIVLSSTQMGKSFFAAEWLLGHAWEKPSRVHPWWWCAPTYGQAMIGFGYIADFARTAGILAGQSMQTAGVRGVRVTYPIITLVNGGTIEGRSWDVPQNLMGTPISGAVIDEAGMIDGPSYAAISTRRSSTMGPLLMLGNPGVLTGPFRMMCGLGEEALVPGSRRAGRYSLYTWTWRDKLKVLAEMPAERRTELGLPSADEYEAFIENERETIKPDAEFRRLYEAEWTADEAAVFRDVKAPDGEAYTGPEPGHEYVTGVDIAQAVDYMVATTACRTCWALVAQQRWRGIPYPQAQARLKLISEHWNSPLVIEENGPGIGVLQALQFQGVPCVPFTTTGPSKQEIIVGLAVEIERTDKRLRIMNLPPTHTELRSYRYQRMPSGNYRYGAPEGEHDDCVMSSAFAVWGLQNVPSSDLSRYGWVQ